MEPTITIIRYLWDARNTWFDCGDKENCDCTINSRTLRHLDDTIPAYLWLAIDEGNADLILRTTEEWDELVGPGAQMVAIDSQIEQLMSAATELMSLRATYERLGDE